MPSSARPVTRRLKLGFAKTFGDQINLVETGGTDQGAATGTSGELTKGQATALIELERLVSAAKRSAVLAFPGSDVLLRAEFQIGINDPQGFGPEMERAGKTLAACKTHAVAIAEHGWLDEDTTAFDAALTAVTGGDSTKKVANSKKPSLTAIHNRSGSVLYKQCLTAQNAARLAFPSTQLGKVDGIEEGRRRYLLDEFPPRGGASAGHGPIPNPPPTPTPNP